ncbi:hypothetical protein [Gallionella capsiferriformans]|uniref:DUF2971 domain-containing protein n=1 Tax=Gallionella capsiferriformans (strain ES-2) TaxID=395494 RepID=D9SGN5_GALCS|nr:hypothetical protein [Gallionella capsiferriformans]ADL55682.1 hypothetical protein Galf_1670 [Gallionella capsiferriformans ES-2]
MNTRSSNSTAQAESKKTVWRYMSFSKFVWTIQNKCLWLCRAELLDDPWEISLSGEQLRLLISRAPISPIGEPRREPAIERAERIVNYWRNNTFINCWNMSEYESNALWQIYCKSTDGVVLQTSYEKLNLIKGPYSLHQVTYPTHGSNKRTPTHTDLVTKKLPMYAYENEVRIVHFDENEEMQIAKGMQLAFDLEQYIESIRVHPQAEPAFFSTVRSVVETYAPNFKGEVIWSDMKLGPPF